MSEIDFDPIKLTQALVKCKSVTPNDDGAIKIIDDHLKSIGFDCTSLCFSDDKSYEVNNLFASYGSSGRHLAFAGHTDVVPAGNEESWQYPPFAAKIVDDKLYGRGTEDMKSNIACFISATNKYLKKYGENFKGKISFIITGDEEGKAINGTAKIMEWTKENNIKIDHCVVGEPTSNKSIGDKIKIGRRGSINFFLIAKGIQGHTANGHRAENPVHYLAKLITNILAKPLDNGNQYFLPSSVQVSTFDVGNNAHNVIPEYAKATLNIRFNNEHTAESLINWLETEIDKIFKNNDKISCLLNTEISARSFINPKGELTKIIEKSIAEATGRNEKPELATDGGTSDARFIKEYCETNELGIRNKTLHQIDEYVYLKDIEQLEKIYFRLIENYFSQGQ